MARNGTMEYEGCRHVGMSAEEKASRKDADAGRAVDVDVDTILRELKQAKDRELRLRVEKERVRKELNAIRTLKQGELWSREAAVRQGLRGVRERRQELQRHELVESEELRRQNEELRDKELSVRLGKRSAPERSAIQSAAAHVVSTSAVSKPDTLSPSTSTSAHTSLNMTPQNRPSKTSQSTIRSVFVSDQPDDHAVPSTWRQDPDVKESLRRLVDVDKQQKRIRSLQEQLEESRRVRDEDSKRVDSFYQVQEQSGRGIESRLERAMRESKMQQDAAEWRTQLLPPPNSFAPKPATTSEMGFTQSLYPPSQYPTAQPFVPPYYHQQGYIIPAPSPYSSHFSPYSSPFSPMLPTNMLPTSSIYSGYGAPLGYPPWPVAPFTASMPVHPSLYMGSHYTHEPFVLSELRRQLHGQQSNEKRGDDDEEFSKVQDMLTVLRHQLSELSTSKSNAQMNLKPSQSIVSVGGDQDDSDLANLKREHMKAIIKVQHERDLLEEEEKLEDAKARVEKRRQERTRDQEQDESIAMHKQELVALRLRHALAKLDPSKKSLRTTAGVDKLYNPSCGVLICLDFVSGLPRSAHKVQLGFAVYDGTVPRTSVKVIESSATEAERPNHGQVIIDSQRTLKPLVASIETRLVIEVSVLLGSTVRRVGWTALQLFFRDVRTAELRLLAGYHKIPLVATPMPNPSQATICTGLFPKPESDVGPSLFCRLILGDTEDESRQLTVDPVTHSGLYSIPTIERQNTAPQGTPQEIPVDSSSPTVLTNSGLVEVGQARQSSASISQDQDFLDVDRLRLLSSSAPGISRAVRPQSLMSGASKTRGIATGGTLATVREISPRLDGANTEPWIAMDKSRERRSSIQCSVFQIGDAFNVYVDAARFLPDNATMTKVSAAALHSDRSKLEPHYGSSQLSRLEDDATSPVYNMYLEFQKRSFNPTLTLILRIDTIDPRSMEGVILGYTTFPLFLDLETLQQPSRSDQPRFALNSGSFQLPVYASANLSGEGQSLSATSVIANAPRVPCTTILVRVIPAIQSEDGLSTLSRADIPREEWVERGLEKPFRGYENGEYDSTASVPSEMESTMYKLRVQQRVKSNVCETIRRMGLNESTAMDLLQKKPPTYWDLGSAFKYQPSIGFRIAIDGMHNIKIKADSICKIIFSVSPPASLYQPVRASSGVYLVASTDWTSLPTSPEYTDGYVTVRDVLFDPKRVVIIDVRAVSKNAKTGAYTSQPLAWSFLPIFNIAESVAAGNFQLPLLTGKVALGVIDSFVDSRPGTALEKKNPLAAFMDGASLFVRLEDPQVPLFKGTSPIVDAIPSNMIPVRTISKYRYDVTKVSIAKKKTPLSKRIPSGMTEAEFERMLNAAVSEELGLEYPRC